MKEIKCEICGRSPAKEMCFTSHQGFLIFRTQKVIEGVFCRDHCLEVYHHSLGSNIKGMWFSPTSLVLGVISSLWDSAKLGMLPEEVVDSPWEIHKILCPNCRKPNWRRSGPAECGHCGSTFTVASCAHCKRVTVCNCSFEDAMIFQCRFCGKRTDPALAVRFSPPFIYCYASAEIITFIGNPETSGKDQLLSQFLEDIEYQFEFNKVTLTFLAKFFNECAEARSQKYIKSVVGSLENDLVSQLFNYAIHSSRLSFDKASLVKSRFLEVANLLGIDRSTAERVADALSTPERQDALDWWTVLGVAIDSSIENIKAAYLAESRKFHPDYSYGLPEHEKQENARKMKEVNLAFELAKVAVEKRSKAGGVKREVSATSFGGDGNSAKSTADKNVNGVNPVAASVSLSSFRVDPSVATMESGKPVTSAKVARGSNFEDFITALVFVGIALAIFILPWVVDRKSTAKRPLVHNAEVTTEDLDYSDRDSSWETVAKSLPKESGINMRPGQKSADTVFQSPVGEPIVCFDQPDLLKISDEPIHAKTFVYDNWFENVPNYPQRYLALDHIYNGEVYFRDRGFRQLQFSLYTITDADLEKVVRYIGQGTGSFLNELLPARDWTMTVADKPVRGSLVGLLNRVVVLRWELKREYVLVGLDQLASDDASYVLFHCEK